MLSTCTHSLACSGVITIVLFPNVNNGTAATISKSGCVSNAWAEHITPSVSFRYSSWSTELVESLTKSWTMIRLSFNASALGRSWLFSEILVLHDLKRQWWTWILDWKELTEWFSALDIQVNLQRRVRQRRNLDQGLLYTGLSMWGCRIFSDLNERLMMLFVDIWWKLNQPSVVTRGLPWPSI